MSNITFHRRHMTAVPTDLLLDPTVSIEAKAFAGILQAIPTGNHDLQELAVLLNVPDERIVPALSELSEIGFLTIKEHDGIFHLNLWYALLLDRASISRQNGYIDPDGTIRLYFTVEQVQKKLHRSRQSATRIFRELEYSGLIIRKKQGLGKPAVITLNYPADARLIMKEEDDVDVG